jgi:hypothetical protein
MLWLCGWDEPKMLVHLASLDARQQEGEEGGGGDCTGDPEDYEDILESGVDIGAGEWL